MGGFSNGILAGFMVVLASLALSTTSVNGGNFFQEFEVTFGDGRVSRYGGGQLLSLTLDRDSGSGFRSKKEYLFGRIDMQLKLVAGDSAGTVTAYYVSKLFAITICIMLWLHCTCFQMHYLYVLCYMDYPTTSVNHLF